MTFECKTMSKKQLAAAYGMKKDTFRRFCQERGVQVGSRRLLDPQAVMTLVTALGPPVIVLEFPATALKPAA